MIKLFILNFPVIITFIFFAGCGGNNSNEKKQLNNGELYYNNSVTQSMVDSLGNYINQCEIFTGGINKGKIVKNDSTYELSLSVPQDKLNDSTYLDFTGILATQLSEDVFHNAPVNVNLTDSSFNVKVTKSGAPGRQLNN